MAVSFRSMKRLMILRHAKSDWNSAAASDHDRPLNRRGTAAALTMGRVLTRIGEIPDVVYTSSAIRAKETAILAADAGGWKTEMVELDELYATSAGAALAVAAGASDSVKRLMLVGHQPTWGYLVRAVTGASVQMKTATVAGIDMHMDRWEHASQAMGSLAYLLQPRLFEEWEV
jgi:phosphohistidine phosphatase